MRFRHRFASRMGSVHERLRGPSEASTLIVPVPGAKELIAACNDSLGITSAAEIPPHITVIYPFVPPSRMDDRCEGCLAEIFARTLPFTFALEELGHFPGVTWLRPTPAPSFEALTEAVVGAFPHYPPYRGAYEATVHHLTVAMRSPLPASLNVIVEDMLPIAGAAEEVWLMCRLAGGRWEVKDQFSLGLARPQRPGLLPLAPI